MNYLKVFACLLLTILSINNPLFANQKSNNNLYSLKFSPCYFVPNKVKKGKKNYTILKNTPEAISFIQTKNTRIIFTYNGAYFGIPFLQKKTIIQKSKNKVTLKVKQKKLKVSVFKFSFYNKSKGNKTRVYLEKNTGGKVNFLTGKRENWIRNVDTYREIVYKDVWDGIDIAFSGYLNKLEYRIIVHKDKDPEKIIIETGTRKLRIKKNGSLIATLGGATLTLTRPEAYQYINGKKKFIKIEYRILKGGKFAFKIGKYNHLYPLIIDPIITWSTYLGPSGTGDERGTDIAILDHFAYITGYTNSSTFPTTPGVFQTSLKSNEDIFVTKLDYTNSTLIFSTFIGGSKNDEAYSIKVNSNGEVFIAGNTYSPDYPATEGAYSETYNGEGGDACITALSADGSTLIFSTFLGGSNYDTARGIELDRNGNIFITGWTNSSDFPTTSGSFNRELQGKTDAFVVKMNETGSALIYSTLIGGEDYDYAFDISVNNSGEAYITGGTNSLSFPANGQELYAYEDAFIMKLSSDGSTISASRLLGGNGYDEAYGIDLDSNGNPYITGETSSSTLSESANGFQTHLKGNFDAFIAKFNSDLSSIIYFSYLGGSKNDQANDITLTSDGRAFITGTTYSTDFPLKENCFQNTLKGESDCFVAALDTNGTDLICSTLLGGNDEEEGNAIALDNHNNVFVTGYTRSFNFPVTNDAYDKNYHGEEDVFFSCLTPTGENLIYSSFLGGSSGEDRGLSVTTDNNDHVYLTGYTLSPDFPVTQGVFDETHSGKKDIFVSKFNPDGSSLEFSTFIGGRGDDEGRSIKVNSKSEVFVAGVTKSNDFPVTDNAFDSTFNGETDGFILKLSSDGSSLKYSTLLGGTGTDEIKALAIDSDDCSYITGYTRSTNFPVTAGAFQTQFNESKRKDIFVTKLDPNGSSIIYSTFIGGDKDDEGNAITIDYNGRAFVTGHTESSDFPVTDNAFESHFHPNQISEFSKDSFLTVIDRNGTDIIYSTFLGGDDIDEGTGIAITQQNRVFITGFTESENFPITDNAFEKNLQGDFDVFITCLNIDTFDVTYSTFVGGTLADISTGITVVGGKPAITGYTYSYDYPVTSNAFSTEFNDSVESDCFFTILDNEQKELNYSTFIGGTAEDIATSITSTGSGVIYITGYTSSSDFPVTPGSYQENGSGENAFLIKLGKTTDLSITKSVNQTTVFYGSEIEFTVTVENIGDTKVKDIEVKDNLPSGFTYLSHNVTKGEYDTQSGLWSIPSLSPMENAKLKVVCKVNSNGTYTNSAVITSSNPEDRNQSNNTASVTITPQQPCFNIYVTTENGTTTDDNVTVCQPDGCTTVHFYPDNGYTLSGLYLNGQPVAFDCCQTEYTFCNIHGDQKLHAIFSNQTAPIINSFTVEPSSKVTNPATITLVCEAFDPDGGNIVKYQWDIDGDNEYEDETTQNSYQTVLRSSKTYYFKVKVIDDEGEETESFTLPVTVLSSNPIVYNKKGISEITGIPENLINLKIINPLNEDAILNVNTYDNSGDKINTFQFNIAKDSATMLENLVNLSNAYNIELNSDKNLIYLIISADEDRAFMAYLGNPVYGKLFLSHIAEETSMWQTIAYISNPAMSTIYYNHQDLGNNLSILKTMEVQKAKMQLNKNFWGYFSSNSNNPFEQTTFNGFVIYRRNDGKIAAFQLEKPDYRWVIPFIPDNKNQFWCGYIITNPENRESSITLKFYNATGDLIQEEEKSIDPGSKYKRLFETDSGSYCGLIRWCTIESNTKVIVQSIYGSKNQNTWGGILGLSGVKNGTELIFPLSYIENYQSSITIVNTENSIAETQALLINSNGETVESKLIDLLPHSQLKTPLINLFQRLSEGCYIKIISNKKIAGCETIEKTDNTALAGIEAVSYR